MQNQKKLKQIYQKYENWVFPAVCTLVFVILSIFSIHGSSIGTYKAIFNPSEKDKNLYFSTPKGIRSDEWVITSPLEFAQKATDFAVINPNIGHGQDMDIVLDLPVRDWTVIFKPQNIAFLLLPFSIAFSFHWWFSLFALMIASYLLFKTLIPPPKNVLLSSLLATTFSVNPFIFWWYSSGTLLPVAYVFLLVFLFIQLLDTSRIYHRLLVGVLMAYLIVCLALTFYIPFIIAVSFAALIMTTAYIFSQKNPRRFVTKQNIILLLSALFIAVLIIAMFYLAHKEAIMLVQNTVYPGKRIASDTPMRIDNLIDIFKQFFLQSNKFVSANLINQSEASNFIYLFLYLLLPGIYIIVDGIRNKKNDWFLITITIGIGLFLTRMLLPLNLNYILKFILLDKVPKERLIIGLGILNIAYIIAIIRNIKLRKKSLPRIISLSSYVAALIILLGQYVVFKSNSNFRPSYSFVIVLIISLLIIATVVLILNKRTLVLAAFAMLVLTLLTSFLINPLYKGVPFEKNTTIHQITQQNNQQRGSWVVLNNIALEQFPQMAGVNTLSGVNIYPQYGIWRSFPNYEDYKDVVNRYAHIQFVINNENNNTIYLNQADLFTVNIDPCNTFAQQHITYLLSLKPETSPCIQQVKMFYDNSQQVYIYKIIKL